MRLPILIVIIVFAFWGCKKDQQNQADSFAYIGGEIINPTNNFIILSKDQAIIDTIKLDTRNRFLYKINNLHEGMFTFRHGGEYQMVLIEANDSLLFRLNTLEFDESLVFTGIGDKKNNYFIETFLEYEKEEKHIIKLCQLNPHLFQKHVDSIKNNKVETLKTFKKRNKTSALFDKIAQANINYNYYSNKEVYPFIHYGKNKAAILKSVPNDFYNYRKDINYSDTFFSQIHNYNTFLRHNLSNISLNTHDSHCSCDNFDRVSLCYNLDRLHLIDSLVTNTTLKNELLHYFTFMYLSKNVNAKNNEAILKSYLQKSENEEDKQMLSLYTKSLNNLKVGSKLPEIILLNNAGKEVAINTLIRGSATVINFWSYTYYNHFKDSHKKLGELKEKYPETNFISININSDNFVESNKMLASHDFDLKQEYLFKNPKESNEILATYPMTKTIILDKNKKIVNSNANIFSIQFEEQLLGALNK